ncbi:MAG: Asp23/Gls24 family envelope stress response protein [Actinomycetota bacterium]|nr:Asp23/Gls24 family envelope stress response protein [Actinomycetota bacterium]
MSEQDQQRARSPLESERGITTIGGSVVSKIAGIAAGEVEGIRMGGSASRAAEGVLGNVTGSQSLSRGVSVEVGRVETAIDLTMAMEYGRNILQLTERVRDRITERVEDLTGLQVAELNVTVNDVIFRGEGSRDQGRRGGPRGEGRRRLGEEDRREDAAPEEDETVELGFDDPEAGRGGRRER